MFHKFKRYFNLILRVIFKKKHIYIYIYLKNIYIYILPYYIKNKIPYSILTLF